MEFLSRRRPGDSGKPGGMSMRKMSLAFALGAAVLAGNDLAAAQVYKTTGTGASAPLNFIALLSEGSRR